MNEWWKIDKKKIASEITQCLLFGFCCHHTETYCISIGTLSSTKCRNGWKVKPNTVLYVEMSNDAMTSSFFFILHRELSDIRITKHYRRISCDTWEDEKKIVYFCCEEKNERLFSLSREKKTANRLFVRKSIWWRFNFVGNMGAVLGLASAAQASASNRIYKSSEIAHIDWRFVIHLARTAEISTFFSAHMSHLNI